VLANLAARSALIVEHPPTVILGLLKGDRRSEGAPALGAAEDATGELPESATGPRAFLVALQGRYPTLWLTAHPIRLLY
jgi:hypothetical protein